jgi:hypothetical protein
LEPVPQDIVRPLDRLGYQKAIDTYENENAVELYSGDLAKEVFVDRGTVDSRAHRLLYMREVTLREGVNAEVALSSEGEYGTVRLVVKNPKTGGSAETSFVVEGKRESSRFLAGLLPINEREKVFYTIEAAVGYSE